MKFYRVSYSQDGGNSGGYSWHTSKADAQRAARQGYENDPQEYDGLDTRPQVEAVEITPTKAGILAALEAYASHEANG